MGAPIGNCNAAKNKAACKIGKHQRGKVSGFRSLGKKRYNPKLRQRNKKSGLKPTGKRYDAKLIQHGKVSGYKKKK